MQPRVAIGAFCPTNSEWVMKDVLPEVVIRVKLFQVSPGHVMQEVVLSLKPDSKLDAISAVKLYSLITHR